MSTPIQWLSTTKLKDIFDDIFRRDDSDDSSGGTSFYTTPIDLAMGFMHYLNDGIVIASTDHNNYDSPSESDSSAPKDVFPWNQIDRIQAQLTESAGQIKQFHTPRAKSVYIASNSEPVQLIKGVRINCEFDQDAQEGELTMVFSETDAIHCLYFSQNDNTLVLSAVDDKDDNQNTVEKEYLENFAKHIVYEMAQARYNRIQQFYAYPYQAGVNFKDFQDEFEGCIFSSITWGTAILTPISEGKQMVNLSVRFERLNRTSFDRRILFIFNQEHMVELMNLFVD